jgi:hypothetical protein
MRATVSFDVGVNRVPETMRCLVLEEAHLLNGVIEMLGSASCETLSKDIDEVLGHLQESSHQLQQYKDMLISFDRARFETMLPQPVAEATLIHNAQQAQEVAESMQKLNSFLDRIDEIDEEVPDDTEEG